MVRCPQFEDTFAIGLWSAGAALLQTGKQRPTQTRRISKLPHGQFEAHYCGLRWRGNSGQRPIRLGTAPITRRRNQSPIRPNRTLRQSRRRWEAVMLAKLHRSEILNFFATPRPKFLPNAISHCPDLSVPHSLNLRRYCHHRRQRRHGLSIRRLHPGCLHPGCHWRPHQRSPGL